MDTKNIVAAISLSAAVIVLYSLFFAPPPITKENMAEGNKVEQNSDTPSLDQKENVAEISREDALNIKVFTRKCKESLINCKYIESNKSLVAELKKEILKRATKFKLEDKEKKNEKK